MTKGKRHNVLIFIAATVWFVNGLFCKVLNLVPRHEQIVAKVLSIGYARQLTSFIGLLEIIMAVWILSRFKPRLNAIVQMLIVVIMNVLEFILVPELLLWGRLNILFASLFVGLIYYTEFVLSRKLNLTAPTA